MVSGSLLMDPVAEPHLSARVEADVCGTFGISSKRHWAAVFTEAPDEEAVFVYWPGTGNR